MAAGIFFLGALLGCSNFLEPVEATGTPSEYEFNYWLLQKTYLYEDELDDLPQSGDSVQGLYAQLEDRYTRYYPPSKSEAAETSINTSYVEGDLGMEYLLNESSPYPLFAYRVYPNGPAARAGIERYSNIRAINGIELTGSDAYTLYQSILDTSLTVELSIHHDSTDTVYSLTKENVYAPTIFLDTLYETIFITITEFKTSTADQKNGTYGELKAYLDSTANYGEPRVLNLVGNPGGHVSQCVSMADLFVPEGILSTRSWRIFSADGNRTTKTSSTYATPGDPGEQGKFIILANKTSASCAEIFTAAVSELTDTKVVGGTTYGKGIGQTNWKTIDGGLAVITNLEFLTPKGNSYHGTGIVPDYDCGTTSLSTCAIDAVQKFFGGKALAKAVPTAIEEYAIVETPKGLGGAMLPSDSISIYN